MSTTFYVFLYIAFYTILIHSKATNGAGIKTFRTFGAFQVDSSAPLAGHVYDSPAAANETHLRDYDWVTEMTSLCASWEGFHDPHSSIVGYAWKIGLCKGCNDVLVEQFIGLANGMSCFRINFIKIFTFLFNNVHGFKLQTLLTGQMEKNTLL